MLPATFQELLEEEDKTLTVTVTTTMPLDDELRGVTEKLERTSILRCILLSVLIPKILGGIVVEARDHRYDASVKTQLTHKNWALFRSLKSEL